MLSKAICTKSRELSFKDAFLSLSGGGHIALRQPPFSLQWPKIYNSSGKGIETGKVGEYYPSGPGDTQIWFGRGCAAQASKPIPIFKG